MLEFRPPRFDAPVDLDAHLALLSPDAACKGLFFNDPIQRLRKLNAAVDPFALAGIPQRRFLPFLNYPYKDFLRLLVASARALYPDMPIGEGLRRLGRAGYVALLESQVGKVLFGVFGRNFEYVVQYGGKGYGVSLNFGKCEVESVAPCHARYHFSGIPGFIETYQVGVIEGGMEVCGVRGDVTVAMKDLANASMDIRWSPQ
jgi:uncharacterized protein (TIGR02265 family)